MPPKKSNEKDNVQRVEADVHSPPSSGVPSRPPPPAHQQRPLPLPPPQQDGAAGGHPQQRPRENTPDHESIIESLGSEDLIISAPDLDAVSPTSSELYGRAKEIPEIDQVVNLVMRTTEKPSAADREEFGRKLIQHITDASKPIQKAFF